MVPRCGKRGKGALARAVRVIGLRCVWFHGTSLRERSREREGRSKATEGVRRRSKAFEGGRIFAYLDVDGDGAAHEALDKLLPI